MKTLLYYLKPHKWLLILSLVLATINQVFSLFSPAITGNILDQLVTHPNHFDKEKFMQERWISFSTEPIFTTVHFTFWVC